MCIYDISRLRVKRFEHWTETNHEYSTLYQLPNACANVSFLPLLATPLGRRPCLSINLLAVLLNVLLAVTEFPLWLDYGQSPHAYVNQRLQIQLELLMMSGMPLETCWAGNERWNNKFCYKVASCWLFLLSHCVTWYFDCLHFPMQVCVTYLLATALCNDP